jgi:hypothetical protein
VDGSRRRGLRRQEFFEYSLDRGVVLLKKIGRAHAITGAILKEL